MKVEMNWARLEWLDSKTPRSPEFQDVYFSSAGVLEEYRHVFHEGGDLPRRWRERGPNQPDFRIGELGFGTALGFLSTWRRWLGERPTGARLQYVSFEKHPISPEDLARIYREYPELASLSQELLAQYPPRLEGIHRLVFDDVSLTLVFGDALKWAELLVLPEGAAIDAWFLHGFAPHKNPDLWSEPLFRALARLSAKGTTVSTFSVASDVVENLSRAGFSVAKAPGFAQKREMLRGELKEGLHERPLHSIGLRFEGVSCDRENSLGVAVIGAGLAGTAAAAALAKRGFAITVFEREAEPAAKASGNALGFFMPFLATQPDPKCRIALRSFAAFARTRGNSSSGAIELAASADERRRFEDALGNMALPPEIATLKTETELRDLSGLGSRLLAPHGGVHYSQGGFLKPQDLCRSYLAAVPNGRIQMRLKTEVSELRRRSDGTWELMGMDSKPLGRFSGVIVANAGDALRLLPGCELPLTSVRGQVASVPALEGLHGLRMPVMKEHYLTPEVEGAHVLGATYDRGSVSPELRLEENAELWDSVRTWVEGLPSTPPSEGRVGFRAYAPDAIAAVGPAVDFARYSALYPDLAQGFPEAHYPPGESLPGLYLSLAHGSRGIASSFFGAEILASLIAGDVLPVERDLAESLHPARFALRRLRRKPALDPLARQTYE